MFRERRYIFCTIYSVTLKTIINETVQKFFVKNKFKKSYLQTDSIHLSFNFIYSNSKHKNEYEYKTNKSFVDMCIN